MPLLKGKSPKTVSKNISEFHKGPTYAHTLSKFGKARANKQAVAVALNTARKYAEGGEVEDQFLRTSEGLPFIQAGNVVQPEGSGLISLGRRALESMRSAWNAPSSIKGDEGPAPYMAMGPNQEIDEVVKKIGEGLVEHYGDLFSPFAKGEDGKYVADQPIPQTKSGKIPQAIKDPVALGIPFAWDVISNLAGPPGKGLLWDAGKVALPALVGAWSGRASKAAIKAAEAKIAAAIADPYIATPEQIARSLVQASNMDPSVVAFDIFHLAQQQPKLANDVFNSLPHDMLAAVDHHLGEYSSASGIWPFNVLKEKPKFDPEIQGTGRNINDTDDIDWTKFDKEMAGSDEFEREIGAEIAAKKAKNPEPAPGAGREAWERYERQRLAGLKAEAKEDNDNQRLQILNGVAEGMAQIDPRLSEDVFRRTVGSLYDQASRRSPSAINERLRSGLEAIARSIGTSPPPPETAVRAPKPPSSEVLATLYPWLRTYRNDLPRQEGGLSSKGIEFLDKYVLPHYDKNFNKFSKEFFNGIYKPENFAMIKTYDGITFSGGFRMGDYDGSVTRTINVDKNGKGFAYHDYLSVPEDNRGAGFAKDLLRKQVDLYQKMGLSYVKTNANIKVGSYSWGRYGFLPYNERSWQELSYSLYNRLQSWIGDGSSIPDQVVEDLIKFIENPDKRSLWNFVDYPAMVPIGERGSTEKRPLKWSQALIMGISWNAKLDFKDAATMRRFNEYVRKGKGK